VSSSTWTPVAVSSEATDWRASIWRIVEAQHVASTMKVVDNAAEQDILESLLESSKPPLPDESRGLDYLLATPFRYDPIRPGSRFRGVSDPGVFYGAASIPTACAELGYSRWKFLMEAEDLDKIEPVAHTAFRADIHATAVDLRVSPFSRDADIWLHPSDYFPTQAFARTAREADIGAIVYQSVRDPEAGWCAAILTPAAFSSKKHHPSTQTWWLAVHQDQVIWRRDHETIAFQIADSGATTRTMLPLKRANQARLARSIEQYLSGAVMAHDLVDPDADQSE
jgi:hypothetical protein